MPTVTSLPMVVVAAVMLSLPAAAADDAKLTVASFSTLIPYQKKAFADSYATDQKVALEFVAMDKVMEPLRAQVASGKVVWDVIDMNAPELAKACDENLLEKIDAAIYPLGADGTPAKTDILPGMIQPCGIGNLAWSSVMAYHAGLADQITLKDVFDLKKYPGKRALNPYPYMNLERALIADGVPSTKVYDVLATKAGEDRAFAKLATLKADLLWLGGDIKPADVILDGRAVFAAANNGSLFRASFEGKKALAASWDGQMWTADMWAIPKGAPHLAQARAFIAHATGAKAQAEQARLTFWGPVRWSSLALIGDHPTLGMPMLPHVVTARPNMTTAVLLSTAFWNKNTERLGKRFEQEFGAYRAPYN